MSDRPAQTSRPIHDLLARRWSTRAFDPTKSVTREQLSSLLEAARWSPSCNGDEPWRFLVWDKTRDAAGFQTVFDALSENNKKWVKNVSLLMLACAGSAFAATGKPNRWSQYDTGAAGLSIALQAEALGLRVHQMGGFDAEKLRAAFGIPADYTPMAMIAVGHQASPDVLDEETKAKEMKGRGRKGLGERFFEGGWGKGVA